MKRGIIYFLLAGALPALINAQNSKVQTAWRATKDYEDSKDIASLMKAKEAIDAASSNDETKEKAKTWVYRSKVYYYLFKNDLTGEMNKLTTIADKDEKAETAYGNVSTSNYEEAGKSLEKASVLDKDKAYQTDMAMVGLMMMNDINNLAIGKYKVKKYDEAMGFFEASYFINKQMGKKDTNSLYNAILCSQKGKMPDSTIKFAQFMIDEKVSNNFTYQYLFDAKLSKQDTAGALKALQAGRAAFPNDLYLMNRETEFYLAQGKQEEALNNLNAAITKDPGNSQLYLVRGNVYDNLANPRDAAGKDKEKPKNYEEYMTKAEADYVKSRDLNDKNFDTWYNLGALYNNWGGRYQTMADDIVKANDTQKQYLAKAQELFVKAVTTLEKALSLKDNDKQTMFALRKLYLLTGQGDKAKEMGERMKK